MNSNTNDSHNPLLLFWLLLLLLLLCPSKSQFTVSSLYDFYVTLKRSDFFVPTGVFSLVLVR